MESRWEWKVMEILNDRRGDFSLEGTSETAKLVFKVLGVEVSIVPSSVFCSVCDLVSDYCWWNLKRKREVIDTLFDCLRDFDASIEITASVENFTLDW